MSTAPKQTTVAIAPIGGVCLAPRAGPSGDRRALLRLPALGLLLVFAVLAVLFTTRTIRVPPALSVVMGRSFDSAPAALRSGRTGGDSAPAAPRSAPTDAPQAHQGTAAGASDPRPAPARVVAAAYAAALFKEHSWYVAPPPPPAAPPPPPPEPTAPPLPYTLVGSYAPEGEKPVYFLANKDRVIDAHVGDQLDGVYQLESANGDQLVFVYQPLNIRQTLAPGQNPAPKGTR